MNDLYTWGHAPIGRKSPVLLEDTARPTRRIPSNIGKDAQFALIFLRISPNNKIPAIVDHEQRRKAVPNPVEFMIYRPKRRVNSCHRHRRPRRCEQWPDLAEYGALLARSGNRPIPSWRNNRACPNPPSSVLPRKPNAFTVCWTASLERRGLHHRRDYSIADMAIFPIGPRGMNGTRLT